MQALVNLSSGPNQMKVVTVPEPNPTANQLKIKVDYVGICGTDLKIWKGEYRGENYKPPVIIGHEFCGTIVEVGSDVTEFHVGDFVTAHPTFEACETCDQCLEGRFYLCTNRQRMGFTVSGALAEYTIISAKHTHKLPSGLDKKRAAILEPLSVATHAVARVTSVCKQRVIVIGPGTIGYLVASVAQLKGAHVTIIGTPTDLDRLTKIKHLGKVLTTEEISDSLNSSGDIVFECSGSSAGVNLAMHLLCKRGQLIQVGTSSHPLTVDYMKVAYKELTVTGSMAAGYEDWEEAIHLVKNIKIDPLIAKTFPLDQWEEAFQTLLKGGGPKVLITPTRD